MSEGITLSPSAFKRTSDVVRWAERQMRDESGGDGTTFEVLSAPIIVEVRVTGESSTGGSGSGAGFVGRSGDTCGLEMYPAVMMVWDNSCGWRDTETIWVFELNDQELNVGQKYQAKILQHNHNNGGVTRPVGYVDIGGAIPEEDGSGSGGGSSGGAGDCTNGVPITYCQLDGSSVAACIAIESGRLVVRDTNGNLLAGG